MNKLVIFFGICLAVALGSELTVPQKEFKKIVGCFYYEEPGSYIDNIDASLCTHMYYSYGQINADASVQIVISVYDKDEFKKFKNFQKKNKNLKTLVSMKGEYPEYPANLIKIITAANLREKFANNVVNLLKKYKFNGMEIDLNDEFLTKADNNGVASNQQNFVLLLKTLREKFDKEGLILCVTVGTSDAIAKLYDIRGVSKYVNFINLKTFDFQKDTDDDMKVGHNAPLYPSKNENAEERKLNIDYVVKNWISKGTPPNKIILGTAFRGRASILANPKLIGRGAPSSGLFNLKGITSPSYNDICPLEKNPQWKQLYDEEQQVPYMYKGNKIISYDNAESITKKAEYVKKMNLGGAMVRNVEEDDVDGKCGQKFPLLRTLNQILTNDW